MRRASVTAITVFLILLLSATSSFSQTSSPTAQANATPGAVRRVALVVGVSKYEHAGILANPANDANDMAAALKPLGFEVETLLDPNRASLEAAVRRFGDRSIGAEVSLFHYSGHALEAAGLNWILPSTANVNSERDLRFEAIDLNAVLEQTDGAARVSIVFLDACRGNPFSGRLSAARRDVGRNGLARVDIAASGMLVAFSTAPGQLALDGTGRNSPFTQAVLKHIATPGLEIKSLLSRVTRDVVESTKGQQRPWQNSSLEGDFYLVPPRVAAPAQAMPVLNPEVVFWDSIKTSHNPADFTAYLARFPTGTFVELARNRLAMLQKAVSSEPQGASPAPQPSTQQLAVASPPAASEPSATLRDQMAARLASLSLAPAEAASQIRDYDAGSGHKAIAAAPKGRHSWRVQRLATAEAAATAALESCQFHYQEPCLLVAVDDTIAQESADAPALRDMPRLHYDGRFDPERIPTVSTATTRRADVTSYRLKTGAKAAAYHPWGRLFVVLDAASQFEAEEKALAQCNDDPGRKGANGPCFLYAAGDRVLLPRRLTKPRPRPQSLSEGFAYFDVASYSNRYGDDPVHKAIAIVPESGQTFRVFGEATGAGAEERALEGCQLQYRTACVLLATDTTLQASDLWQATRKDMPRLHYEGKFRPDNVPLFASKAKEVQSYAGLPEPKAMAIRPSGSRVRIATGATLQEAQAKALAACNEGAGPLPCFVYAANDRVVVGQRRTEPLP